MRTNEERFQDVIESGEQILDYISRLQSGDHGDDEDVFHDAILHQLTIIGEAIANIDEQLKQKYSQIPCAVIKAFRNVLIHEYAAVRWDRVWNAVDRVPELIDQIKNILEKEYGIHS